MKVKIFSDLPKRLTDLSSPYSHTIAFLFLFSANNIRYAWEGFVTVVKVQFLRSTKLTSNLCNQCIKLEIILLLCAKIFHPCHQIMTVSQHNAFISLFQTHFHKWPKRQGNAEFMYWILKKEPTVNTHNLFFPASQLNVSKKRRISARLISKLAPSC